ncbi:MAG: nucleoside kinase, partial [Cetobacterium sp.]
MENFETRKYHLTAKLVLLKAINDIFPEYELTFRNSLNNGVYITINGKEYICEEDVEKIKKRMKVIISEKKDIKKSYFTSEKINKNNLQNIRDDLKELLETTGIVS